MLKTKIKISQITNLTDARYFAAWGVDYLGFDINPQSDHFVNPATLQEITEWVEGPEVVLEYPGIPEDLFLNDYRSVLPSFLLQRPEDLGMEVETHSITDSQGNYVAIVIISEQPWHLFDIETIAPITDRGMPVFLDIPFSTRELDEIIASEVSGLVLRGGEEEKTGVKSYEDLDELFEALMP